MQPRKKLNLGSSDFKSLMENDNYFVDKSLFIEEVIESEYAVLLLPRPRRFGKTLNLSMLRHFFDVRQPENINLFTDLKIWQCGEHIKAHQGRYPVIYMSFKDAKGLTWENTLEHIKHEIKRTYFSHYYLLESNILYPHERDFFNDILQKKASVVEYELSIITLCEYLQRYYNENVIILIDEYDAPIQAGYKKFYNEVVTFMRTLLSGAYKDNSFLKKGVITGILRVSRESIFSGLNNLSVHSILDIEFSDKFGFTEPEVKQLLTDFNINTDYSLIKQWYDGYKIGEINNIYNPWSILNFVSGKKEIFKPFWSNSSSNDLIKSEINKRDADIVREDVLKLISGESIIKDIEPNFVFPDLENRKSLIWTLLTFSGYLTIKEQNSRRGYELVIPNHEIRTVFQDTIIEWIESGLKIMKSRVAQTINSLITNNLTDFEYHFRLVMGDTFSYFDTSNNPEYVYQAYTLGLLAIIGDYYIIKSNRESGGGRYDIMMIPHDKQKKGVVIEIKQVPKQKKTENEEDFIERINTALAQAKNQIEKNKYYMELIENRIDPQNIVKVPIVFAGKIPYINTLTEFDG